MTSLPESNSKISPCESFLQNLIATWSGHGSVFFPTMPSAVYYSVDMSANRPMGGKTVAKFVESHLESRHAEKFVGMHFESGFWRCIDANRVSWMVAHNSGNAEAVEGVVADDGKSAILESTAVVGSPETKKTRREISFSSSSTEENQTDLMKYSFYMQTSSVEKMTPHLQMTLKKLEGK
jgi:hypothetical protein